MKKNMILVLCCFICQGCMQSPRDKAIQAIRDAGGKVIFAPGTDESTGNLGDKTVSMVMLNEIPVDDSILVHVSKLTEVTSLWIIGTEITDQGLTLLGDLQGLQSLFITNNQISDAGIQQLPQVKLVELTLGGTKITDESLKHFSNSSDLNTLNVGKTAVSDRGLQYVSQFKKLERLYLHETQITDEGMQQIQGLKNLKSLMLNETEITDSGLTALRNLDQLEELFLNETKIRTFPPIPLISSGLNLSNFLI